MLNNEVLPEPFIAKPSFFQSNLLCILKNILSFWANFQNEFLYELAYYQFNKYYDATRTNCHGSSSEFNQCEIAKIAIKMENC